MTNFLKTVTPFVYLAGGVCAGFGVLYPNTLGLEYYRKLTAVHKPDGTEENVDIEITKLSEEIANKLEWTKEQKERTRVFPCLWIDFVHKGNSNSRWGAIIGIPGYMVSSLNFIDKVTSSEKLGNFTVDWASPTGQNLRQSLIMMSNAKKFSLAKEMCEVDCSHNFLLAGVTATIIPGAYFTNKLFQIMLGFNKSRILKTISYIAVFPPIFLTYIFLKDGYNCRKQEKIDDKLASLGPEMMQSGVDYYSAMIARNQALLSLCGKAGGTHITYYGNKRSSWRKPEPLLTERRDKMIKRLKG